MIREELSSHVEIASVYPNEREYAEFVEQRLHEAGFDVQRQKVEEDRFNLLARKGDGETTVGFYGHLDTVSGSWDRDQYDPWVSDGRLYGLGACDMKAGNLAIIRAIEEIPENVTVEVAFGVDEEYYSKGSTKLVDSGWFSGAEIVIIPEVGDKKSHRDVGLGRRGRVSIEATIFGTAAHAARPHEGESAIRNAITFVDELDAIELAVDEDMGAGQLTIRRFHADAGSLSIPRKASVLIDRHTVIGETGDACVAQVEAVADRAGLDADVDLFDRPTRYLEPYKTSADVPIVSRFLDVVDERHGSPSAFYGQSVADENRIAELGVPVISYGPIGGNEHAENEWVDLESVAELVGTYEQFLASVSELPT